MKNLKEIIQEKLKINSKSKVTKTLDLDDFSKYIESTSFGKPLTEIKNNKIQTGKFYDISGDSDNVLIYLFPLYLTTNKNYCTGISLTYDTSENTNYNYCVLNYVLATSNGSNKLSIDKLMSNKQIEDVGDNINVEKYINIIENLYKISKKTSGNNFLLKYYQQLNEINK